MLPELFYNAKATLGEGPAWDAKTQTLYWVDILEKRIYAGSKLFLQLDDYVGCLAPRKDGGLVIAQRFGFWTFEPDTNKLTTLASPKGEPSNNRFNDGKCDPAGRFVAGTMDHNEQEASGALYSLSTEGRVKKLLKEVRISNGIAWSPDHKTMYFIDTPTREVKAFDYDIETGQIANPRVLIHLANTFGWPDGMTTDMKGNLWIALWGGARVSQWNAKGVLLEQFGVPALNVTSCVFGGPDMNELFITTARVGMDAAALKKYPQAGGVFRMQTDVTGMPTFEFGA
ncbi:MAG: SMP-30/gluconolactonase/LRE family protein [Chloroflexi bacterium]|nr:SMP-30/gluconolactonase/LRE family protein [Chloroflexota bacterium]